MMRVFVVKQLTLILTVFDVGDMTLPVIVLVVVVVSSTVVVVVEEDNTVVEGVYYLRQILNWQCYRVQVPVHLTDPPVEVATAFSSEMFSF